MESLKKWLNKHTFTYEELVYLNNLLSTNMPVSQCLDLIENDRNSKMIASIKNKLEKDYLIEECFPEFLPRNVRDYFVSLIKNLSFNDALDLSLSFTSKAEENEKLINGSLAYPLGLLFLCLTGLYLFDLYGIDTIIDLLKSFKTDVSLFSSYRVIMRLIIYVTYFGMLIMSVLILFLTRPKRISILYLLLSKIMPDSLLHSYYTQEFVSLLVICHKKGFMTKESLNILGSMKSRPVISFMAFHLDNELLDGKQYNEAVNNHFFDSSLSKYLKIAIFSNDFDTVLQNYVDISSKKLKQRMKTYTTAIQLLTYGFIGIIIVFIYQVLFLPMQALVTY